MISVQMKVKCAGNKTSDAMRFANNAVGMATAIANRNKLANPALCDAGALQAALFNKQELETVDDYLESAEASLLAAVKALSEARADVRSKRVSAGDDYRRLQRSYFESKRKA